MGRPKTDEKETSADLNLCREKLWHGPCRTQRRDNQQFRQEWQIRTYANGTVEYSVLPSFLTVSPLRQSCS